MTIGNRKLSGSVTKTQNKEQDTEQWNEKSEESCGNVKNDGNEGDSLREPNTEGNTQKENLQKT